VRCLQRIGRRGLATACIEGMMAAAAPHVAVMDADLQHDESVLPRMLAEAESGAEVVVATRYAQGGGTGDWDASRERLSRLATRIGRAVVRTPTTDPMSGFFLLKRTVIEETARGLSGIGFKILLDVLATARRPLRLAEVPYTFRNRLHGDSKLDENVLWEYGMLLADKTVGRYVPVRFLTFSIIGGLGVFVHMAVLALLAWLSPLDFARAQVSATVVAMVFNFGLNNVLTYRDRRLRGVDWFKGLLIFMLACSIGAVANVGVANYVFRENDQRWALAALAGVMISATWNYTVTRLYAWNKIGR
jgi:dolichol-phosphate mannosyltransferase